MTLLEKVLLVQVTIQTPAVIFLCFERDRMGKAIRQLQLRVFYKPEDNHD